MSKCYTRKRTTCKKVRISFREVLSKGRDGKSTQTRISMVIFTWQIKDCMIIYRLLSSLNQAIGDRFIKL